MDPALHRLLRLAVACLLLSAAWSHFYWETAYRAALEAYPEVSASLRVEPEVGGRIAGGFAIWFLLTGIVTVWWRPGWLARTMLVLTMIPLAVQLVAEAGIADPGWSWVTTRGWGILATLTLAIAGRGWSGAERFLLRAGLTAAFGTWAIEGLGWLGDVPEHWLAAVRACWPGGHGSLVHLRVLAGLALVGCVCLWMRSLVPAGVILLAAGGVAAILVPLGGKLEGPVFEFWHRWLPEAIGKLGLVLLPAALWFVGSRRRLQTPPRRLKRVETPEDAS